MRWENISPLQVNHFWGYFKGQNLPLMRLIGSHSHIRWSLWCKPIGLKGPWCSWELMEEMGPTCRKSGHWGCVPEGGIRTSIFSLTLLNLVILRQTTSSITCSNKNRVSVGPRQWDQVTTNWSLWTNEGKFQSIKLVYPRYLSQQ